VNRHDASRLAVGLRTALKLVAACAPPSAPKRDPRSLASPRSLNTLRSAACCAGSSCAATMPAAAAMSSESEINTAARERRVCVRERTKEEKLEFGPQLRLLCVWRVSEILGSVRVNVVSDRDLSGLLRTLGLALCAARCRLRLRGLGAADTRTAHCSSERAGRGRCGAHGKNKNDSFSSLFPQTPGCAPENCTRPGVDASCNVSNYLLGCTDGNVVQL
jgi:hypothetical protein